MTWTGTTDNDWSKAGNWDPAQVPGPGDTAVIPEWAVVSVVYDAASVTLDCSGEVSVASDADLHLTGTSYLRDGGRMSGDGDITIAGDGSELWWRGGFIDGGGHLTLEENTVLVVDAESGVSDVSLGRYLVNNGHVMVDDGWLALYRGSEGSGSIAISESGSVSFDEGYYEFGGDCVNGGEMAIWHTASVGFDGGYRQEDTGILVLKAWGTGSSEYCKLDVDGEACLDGVLEIHFLSLSPEEEFAPQLGDIFEIVSCGSRIGEFSSIINNMEDEGINLVPTYTATGLTLTVSEPSEFAGGSGTEGDPYLIAAVAQLNNVRNHLDRHFRLTADLNLTVYGSGEGWEPIGTSTAPFTGGFDGNGYTISNLVIDRPGDAGIGLFGYTGETAKIRNLELVDVNISGNYDVGGLRGWNYGLIANCHANATVTTNSSYAGGLVAENYGDIVESYATGNVTGSSFVGGLVGQNKGASEYGTGTIQRCYATGDATGTEEWINYTFVGGLVGHNMGLINNSYARGAIWRGRHRRLGRG